MRSSRGPDACGAASIFQRLGMEWAASYHQPCEVYRTNLCTNRGGGFQMLLPALAGVVSPSWTIPLRVATVSVGSYWNLECDGLFQTSRRFLCNWAPFLIAGIGRH